MNEDLLTAFKERTEQLALIYQADPERFASERAAVTQAELALERVKQESAQIIARREAHTALIETAYKAGALLVSERAKILGRYNCTYAMPNLETAQKEVEAAWMSFWNALKKAERRKVHS